jgi:hypothetical protein
LFCGVLLNSQQKTKLNVIIRCWMTSVVLRGLEAMGRSVCDTITNAPKGAYYRADRDWNLYLHRRETLEIVHLVAPKPETSEFLVLLEEPRSASVQTIFFDVGHEDLEGDCRGSGCVL